MEEAEYVAWQDRKNARRLQKETGVKYTQALRVVRQQREDQAADDISKQGEN